MSRRNPLNAHLALPERNSTFLSRRPPAYAYDTGTQTFFFLILGVWSATGTKSRHNGYLEEVKCYFRRKSNRLARALRNRIRSLDERHAWRYTFFALPFREPVFLGPASTTPYNER